MFLRKTLFAAAAALLVPVSAAQAEGFYIGASGLAVFLEDSDIDSGIASGTAEFDTGYGARGFVGYEIIDNLRLELEGSYRENDTDKLTNGISVGLDGDVRSIAGMANAYYDFGFVPLVTPYIGGGIGVANVKADADAEGIGNLVDDDDTVFAYQVAAG